MEHERVFGMPIWLVVVVLGGAGVVGYLIFRSSSGSSSSGGGATGYSSQGLAVMQNPDESATMALQNQELSILANQQSIAFNTIGNALNQGFGDLQSGLVGDTTALQQQMGGLAQQGTDTQTLLNWWGNYLQAVQNGQVSNLSSQLSGDVTALQQQMGGLAQQGTNLGNAQNASSSANNAYYQALMASLMNYANSLTSSSSGTANASSGAGAGH